MRIFQVSESYHPTEPSISVQHSEESLVEYTEEPSIYEDHVPEYTTDFTNEFSGRVYQLMVI